MSTRTSLARAGLSLLVLLPVADAGRALAAGGRAAATPQASADALPTIERGRFNALAQEAFLPLFWRQDSDGDGQPDPDEMAYLWGVGPALPESHFWQDGAFTPAFGEAWRQLHAQSEGAPGAPRIVDEAEEERRSLVRRELSQGRPTLVEWDFRGASDEDRAIVSHVLAAARMIERIHQRQQGVFGWDAQIPADDDASRALFFRNQGPFCLQPATEQEPGCHALPGKPARTVGIYPAALQARPGFCEELAQAPGAESLTSPFSVVREGDEGLRALPYHVAYAPGMKQIAAHLRAAADAIRDPGEAAFQTYLRAAAQAFLDNRWEPADESWAKMNATNSKWYLRIGPDETYWEPCSLKAGFHVSFARINQASLEWQRILDPLKNEMEQALAALAGPPYEARRVDFHVPDFIDIVLNAGDSRSHAGATIGQSLPNWGPVANEGRGRTVAMSNLYTDEDSQRTLREQASALFCAKTMKDFDASPSLMNNSTVLHEAAHNLGPAHEYRVAGKTDDQIFGGPVAAMLEELKSQSAALYFTDWLAARKIIDPTTAARTHIRDVAWAFGHIAQGMYTAEKKPKAYSQLAAIQVGALLDAKALVWRARQKAANGRDMGCFDVVPARRAPAVEQLLRQVLHIKGAGDREGAEALRARYVDPAGVQKRHALIAERWLRAPKATFVYSVRH